MPLKGALISTLIHILELSTCLGAAFLTHKYLSLGSAEQTVLAGIALNAIFKFARANEKSPINDYVNNF